MTIAADGRYPWFQLYRRSSDKVVEMLLDLAKFRQMVLYAWCVMPDHIHMLVQDENVIELVRLLKGRLTIESRRLELGRNLWQRSFHDHALRGDEPLLDVALYIWQNPVRAGIIDSACDYPWSGSLVWLDWKVMLGVDGRAGITPAPTEPGT
ncbi:MAG TPA: transposase [Syntrophobacteraceae bacterium]|nr:transposase [Syntrophobacteraceae bacterium]